MGENSDSAAFVSALTEAEQDLDYGVVALSLVVPQGQPQ